MPGSKIGRKRSRDDPAGGSPATASPAATPTRRGAVLEFHDGEPWVVVDLEDLARGADVRFRERQGRVYPDERAFGRHRRSLRVPDAVGADHVIRLEVRGRRAGDPLAVRLGVRPHPYFTTSGYDVTTRQTVVAAPGTTCQLEQLDGETVTLQVPDRSATLRLAGRGLPRPDGGRGDLYVPYVVGEAGTAVAATLAPPGPHAHGPAIPPAQQVAQLRSQALAACGGDTSVMDRLLAYARHRLPEGSEAERYELLLDELYRDRER